MVPLQSTTTTTKILSTNLYKQTQSTFTPLKSIMMVTTTTTIIQATAQLAPKKKNLFSTSQLKVNQTNINTTRINNEGHHDHDNDKTHLHTTG